MTEVCPSLVCYNSLIHDKIIIYHLKRPQMISPARQFVSPAPCELLTGKQKQQKNQNMYEHSPEQQ